MRRFVKRAGLLLGVTVMIGGAVFFWALREGR